MHLEGQRQMEKLRVAAGGPGTLTPRGNPLLCFTQPLPRYAASHK